MHTEKPMLKDGSFDDGAEVDDVFGKSYLSSDTSSFFLLQRNSFELIAAFVLGRHPHLHLSKLRWLPAGALALNSNDFALVFLSIQPIFGINSSVLSMI